jgi:hypothetical protein
MIFKVNDDVRERGKDWDARLVAVRGVCVGQDEGVCALARSPFVRDFRGVDGTSFRISGRCELTGLLPLIKCLSGGMLNRGGVGLVKNLLGGVKGCFCSQRRSATMVSPHAKPKLTGKGKSVFEEANGEGINHRLVFLPGGGYG